jgi:TRAP-type C4-dicarboxylate transport system permease small subunit
MHAETPTDAFGRLLLTLSRGFAILGGFVLVGITLMAVASIIGRELFRKPIQGDFELVQLACAVCVAAFLPYCQFVKANIIVDFFTTRLSRTAQNRLDALGALILGLVMALACWRTGIGMMTVLQAGETSMIMGVPVWLSYGFMTPGFALTAVVAFYTAWQSWTDRTAPVVSEAEQVLEELGLKGAESVGVKA